MKRANIFFMVLFLSAHLFARNADTNRWQLGFTFGEIPILSGSFKPGLTVGYHFNRQVMIEFTYQLKDYLQRDEESFNAVNIGFDGLVSSKETTGERIFLGFRYKPADWSPYLTAGLVYNVADIETIKFDSRERQIGNSIVSGEIEIEQKRESGYAPAVGLGYQYDFSESVSVNTSFAMAFFNDIRTPSLKINSEEEINVSDLKALEDRMEKTYKDNFHNRYHIFNLGVIYRFN